MHAQLASNLKQALTFFFSPVCCLLIPLPLSRFLVPAPLMHPAANPNSSLSTLFRRRVVTSASFDEWDVRAIAYSLLVHSHGNLQIALSAITDRLCPCRYHASTGAHRPPAQAINSKIATNIPVANRRNTYPPSTRLSAQTFAPRLGSPSQPVRHVRRDLPHPY